MFTVPAAIRRGGGAVDPPIFTGPVNVPNINVDTDLVHQMSQYFSGDPVDSYALTNNGGQAWLTLNTSTGELGGTAPSSPVTVSGVIVTATNDGGSTPTDAFGFEVEDVAVSTDFILTVRTTGAGESFRMPTHTSSGTYSCQVDWGDGIVETMSGATDAKWNHTYADAGDYEIHVDGTFTLFFSTLWVADANKIISIDNIGDTGLSQAKYENMTGLVSFTSGSLAGSYRFDNGFSGCTSLQTVDTTGCVNTAGVTTDFFYNCTSLVTAITPGLISSATSLSQFYRNTPNLQTIDMSGWNTSSVTSLIAMLWGTGTNHGVISGLDLSGFNVTSLTDAANMLGNGTQWTTTLYDDLLSSWSAQTLNSGVALGVIGIKYSDAASRLILTDPPNNWNITDGGPV